jgi:hypothetical protein
VQQKGRALVTRSINKYHASAPGLPPWAIAERGARQSRETPGHDEVHHLLTGFSLWSEQKPVASTEHLVTGALLPSPFPALEIRE